MSIPDHLSQALAEEVAKFSQSQLQKAYAELTDLYRTNRKQINNSLNSAEKRIAYIAARMPATYGAISRVLEEIHEDLQDRVTSMLDVGAGPGTATWAVAEHFPKVSQFTLIERESEMLSLGKRMAYNNPRFKSAHWISESVEVALKTPDKYDLVIASYSFNEFPKSSKLKILQSLWEKTNHSLVLIDPGSKEAFSSLHEARSWLIEEKAHIVAPCTHQKECPAVTQQDWCHFRERIQRSTLHRFLKEGERGYEDEKFSYLIVSKEKNLVSSARIVRNPEIKSGHLKLHLCNENGFEQKIYSKKDGNLYKKAKKSAWGDPWEPTP